MSERTSYAPGTHCWVDYGTADLDASIAFYADLLGWEVPEMENSADLGGYRRAKMEGADVAGLYPQMQEGVPPNWMAYISVEDAEATAAKVNEAGGQTIAGPMALPEDLGKLGVFMDPTGAAFGIWEPGVFAGAAKVNEPGAFGWNELGTRDPGAAKAFYGAVFGWSYRDLEMKRNEGQPGPDVYTELLLNEGDEESIGGMMDIGGMLPDQVPAHWLTYFVVEDTDAALEKIKAAGGDINFGPVDIPAGRFAVVREPNGGPVFAVIALPES